MASMAKEANAQKKLMGHAHSTSLIKIGPQLKKSSIGGK
jgi:hypothetical protein